MTRKKNPPGAPISEIFLPFRPISSKLKERPSPQIPLESEGTPESFGFVFSPKGKRQIQDRRSFFSGFWRKSQAIFSRDRVFPLISMEGKIQDFSFIRPFSRTEGKIEDRSENRMRFSERSSIFPSVREKEARNRRGPGIRDSGEKSLRAPISFLLSSPSERKVELRSTKNRASPYFFWISDRGPAFFYPIRDRAPKMACHFRGAISARLSSPKERKGEKRSVKKSLWAPIFDRCPQKTFGPPRFFIDP